MLKVFLALFIFSMSAYSQASDILLRENVHVIDVDCDSATIEYHQGNSTVLKSRIRVDSEKGDHVQSFDQICGKLKTFVSSEQAIHLLVEVDGRFTQTVGFIENKLASALVNMKDHAQFKKTKCGQATGLENICLMESKKANSRTYVQLERRLPRNTEVFYIPANLVNGSYTFMEPGTSVALQLRVDNSTQNGVFPAVLTMAPVGALKKISDKATSTAFNMN